MTNIFQKSMKPKTLFSIQATTILATIFLASQSAHATNYWFDLNSTTTGFGVADAATYDWNSGNVWGANNAGTGALIAWPGGSNAPFFTGAGAGTTYTVRLEAVAPATLCCRISF